LKQIAKAYCQGAKLVFLDASHTFASTMVYLLSTKREAKLSFLDALNNATNLAKRSREKLLVVVVSSVSSYEHQTIAFVVPMPSQLLWELSNKA